jgi:exonuclease VII small subunit
MTKKKLNEKILELNEQVEWFYGDNFKLEEASEKYRAATKLAKEIETDLNDLKNEIKVIEADFSRE